MLQSHCTVWPSRRLLRIPVAPVERNVGHPGWSGNFLSPPGVISVGPVVPGLILVSFRVKTSRKIPVLPGVLRVVPDELDPPRYGVGVFPEDSGCRCILEPPRSPGCIIDIPWTWAVFLHM